MNVLLIRAGAVVDCIGADSLERAQLYNPKCTVIEQFGAIGPGWLYDGNAFTQPAPQPVPPPDKTIAPNAFDARFTTAEWLAIDAASQQQTPLGAAIRRYLGQLNRTTRIDMGAWNCYSGTHQLERAGLIAAGRADEILNTPVKASERPEGY